MEENTPPPLTTHQGLALASRLGMEMVIATLLGLGIGWGLDAYWGSKPWLTIVFFFFGVTAGFLNVYRLINPGSRWPNFS